MNSCFLVVKYKEVSLGGTSGYSKKVYWNGKRFVCSYLYAKVFDEPPDLNKLLLDVGKLESLSPKRANTIRKFQLKTKVTKMFKMKETSPDWLLADICEENGMIEESKLLREKGE